MVAAPTDPNVRADRTLDAAGLVVMPGGIDMHCHIAGPKVNVARKMRPEEKRKAEKVRRTANTHSGTMGSVPSTFATGYKYAGMGYTTAFDAAIPPLAARHRGPTGRKNDQARRPTAPTHSRSPPLRSSAKGGP